MIEDLLLADSPRGGGLKKTGMGEYEIDESWGGSE